MAEPKDFYVRVDMHGLEILNHRLHVLDSDPSSPSDGTIWYNTTDDQPKVRVTKGSTQSNRSLIADDDDFQSRLNTVTTIQDADMLLIYDDSASSVDHQGKYRQISRGNFISGLSTVVNAYSSVIVDLGITTLNASGSSSLILSGDGTLTKFIGTSPGTNKATLTWLNQSANRIFAGPVSGGSAIPTFRSLVDADMPTSYNYSNWDTAYNWGNHALIGYIKADGTVPLTANWDVGNFDVTSKSMIVSDDFYVGTVGLNDNTPAASGASLIGIPTIGSATYTNIEQTNGLFASAGCVTDNHITQGTGETVNVASGSGFIKATDSDVARLLSFDWAAVTGISIPTNTTMYIGVEYNGGSPQVVARTTENWDHDSEFSLGTVVNTDGILHIFDNPWQTTDAFSHIIERFTAENGVVSRDRQIGGLIIGESGDGNRYVTITAGRLWSRFNKFTIDSIDTSSTDRFHSFYSDGSGGWLEIENQQVWDNTHYDDGTGTLATLNNNWFTNLWFFITMEGEPHMIYGQDQYSNSSSAEVESVPTPIPEVLQQGGILLGRILIQEGETTATEVQSAFDQQFTASLASDHNNLSGLQGGTASEYYHLTSSQYTTLVTKVGTPANNQIGVWTGDGTIEGSPNFTYNGTDLNISGDIVIIGARGFQLGADVSRYAYLYTDGTDVTQYIDVDSYSILMTDLGVGSSGTLAKFVNDGTIFFPNLGDNDTEDHLLAINDSTGLLTKRSVSSLVVGGGNVTKVGTPVDNQIGVWTGDGTIEGTSRLTYSGTKMSVSGSISADGQIEVDNAANAYIRVAWIGNDSVIMGQTSSGGYFKLYDGSTNLNFEIDSSGNVDASGDLTVTGKVSTATLQVTTTPTAGYVLTADASGNATWTAASGDVTKYGTAADNQIAVWKTNGSIEGNSNLQWSGTLMTVGASGAQNSIKLYGGSSTYQSPVVSLFRTGIAEVTMGMSGGTFAISHNPSSYSDANLLSSATLTLDGTDVTIYGDITADDFVLSSDPRLKNLLNKKFNGLDTVLNFKVHQFKWKDKRDDYDHVGFLTTEMSEIRPELVKEIGGYGKMSYSMITAINSAAIQDLHNLLITKEDKLKERIKVLEQKVKELQNG